MVKIQELTDLRDYFWSSSEDSTRLSTPDKASPMLLLLNRKLYKWRTTSRVWCVDFHRRGAFYRGEWDLHQHEEVSLARGGGQAAKTRGRAARWSGLCQLKLLLLV
jgi:hypothetical protein